MGNDTVNEMVALWEAVLGRAVAPSADLFIDLGADSLQILELVECVSDQFDVLFTIEELLSAPTAYGAAGAVAARRAAAS